MINNCPSAPAGNGNPGPWRVFGAPQGYKGACTAGSGDYVGPLGAFMAPATLDGVQVVVPSGSGITIAAAKIWWFVPQASGATTYALASVNDGGIGEWLSPKDNTIQPNEWSSLPTDTTELTLADYCSNSDAGGGCTLGGGENPDLELLGAQLTLADDRLPSGTVTGGALASTGPVSGGASIAYDAEDSEVGVRLVQLLVDGHVVAERDYLPECPYQDFLACPPAVSGDLQWNTGTVGDGTHEVAVRVINAAGNGLTVGEHSVVIDNQPPKVSSPPPAGPSPSNESLPSASLPSGSLPAASVPSTPSSHVANGDPCPTPQLELEVNGQHGTLVGSYGVRVSVKGVLHCGAAPIRGALVAVTSIGGPPLTTAVTTGLDGAFSYQVPPGPNRRLQFSYTAYSDESHPAASALVALPMRPDISLRITPSHTSNWHKIRWSGEVAGGPIPQQGVTLNVEVKEGSRWKLFNQVVTKRSGAFTFRYRFHATTEPTTYRFRVALPQNGSAGYPYAPGASNVVAVRVLP